LINIDKLDKDRTNLIREDHELLKLDPEKVRSFYSLTAPARKEYAIQMAEADAESIRIIRQAQAEGIVAIRKAEAEGLRLIGNVLSESDKSEQILQIAQLFAQEDVAQSLADGKATKLFLPQSIGDIFSLIASIKETGESPGQGS
jgi:regulator of protease activity HflC (stomatin/prohibitin superfamily)